jgi:hypothetical protein
MGCLTQPNVDTKDLVATNSDGNVFQYADPMTHQGEFIRADLSFVAA